MAIVLGLIGAMIDAGMAGAKTPGRTYCFLGHCHRVLTLAETRRMEGRTETLRTSFYDDCARDRFNPCSLTSSGERFRPHNPDNAASPIYPDGTLLLLFYRATGAAAVVRVNNAGPYHSKRLLDVSRATADAMGFSLRGVADLDVRVLAAPQAEDATYRRNRRYWPVHGPIGRHASIEDAHAALQRVTADELTVAAASPAAAAAEAAASPAVVEEPAVTVAAGAPTGEASPQLEPQEAADTPAVSAAAPSAIDAPLDSAASAQSLIVASMDAAPDREPDAGPSPANPLHLLPPAAQRLPRAVETPAQLPLAEDEPDRHPLSRFAPAIARNQTFDTKAVEAEAGVATVAVYDVSRAAAAHGAGKPAPPEPGLFSALRASARRGVTPARLPEISLDDGFGAVSVLLDGLYSAAVRARSAARAGLTINAVAAGNPVEDQTVSRR